MAKTYYPGAYLVAYTAHRYLTRYQTQLNASVTSPQAAALATLIGQLSTFLIAWPKPTELP